MEVHSFEKKNPDRPLPRKIKEVLRLVEVHKEDLLIYWVADVFSIYWMQSLRKMHRNGSLQTKNSLPISTSTHMLKLSPEEKMKAWKSWTFFHSFMSVVQRMLSS